MVDRMVTAVVEQLLSCVSALDELGHSVAAVHIANAIEILVRDAESADGTDQENEPFS